MSLGRTSTALGAFYRRLAVRIGKAKAITATARKHIEHGAVPRLSAETLSATTFRRRARRADFDSLADANVRA